MSAQTSIVDTNVIRVANGQHERMSPESVTLCAKRLMELMQHGRIAVDDNYRILHEYQKKELRGRAKGPGDAFVKWLLQNNRNTARCDLVPIREHPERGYESFPDDPDLVKFDASDRMFVAVAVAHDQHPPILQASDSKWLDWMPALKRYGIIVDLLCEGDIQKFHENKFPHD